MKVKKLKLEELDLKSKINPNYNFVKKRIKVAKILPEKTSKSLKKIINLVDDNNEDLCNIKRGPGKYDV